MDSNLFDHINIDKANTYVAKGTGDAEENLREFNAVPDRADIDAQVLGVGRTVISASGPGDLRSATAPCEVLDEAPSTLTAATFSLQRDDVPLPQLTMGSGRHHCA